MNRSNKIMIKVLGCVVALCSWGCAGKQEHCKYHILNRENADFSLTARLDGTFYEDRYGDVSKPYTLFVSVHPKNSQKINVANISLYVDGEEPVVNVTAPKLEMERDIKSNPFYFIRISELDIPYEEYVLKFNVVLDGGKKIEVKCVFEKNYSSRRTTKWLEIINSA